MTALGLRWKYLLQKKDEPEKGNLMKALN